MSFAQQMRQWAKNTGLDTDDLVRGVNLQLTRQVIELTPVGRPDLWKTKYPPKGYTGGRAKGNWFATTGTPSTEIDNKARVKNDAIMVRKAQNAIANSPGNVYFIINNLPYIRRIEYEQHSQQIPEGMVRRTVANFNQLIEQKARQTKRKSKI